VDVRPKLKRVKELSTLSRVWTSSEVLKTSQPDDELLQDLLN